MNASFGSPLNFFSTTSPASSGFNPQIPVDVLDDLSSRFIINIPQEERRDVIRVMFQMELAHWFYLDWICTDDKPDTLKVTKVKFRQFCKIMFNHVPFLQRCFKEVDTILDNFKSYKSNVPTYGAILLDEAMENVLMVQGYWSKANWGFPKGKVNHEEEPHVCACREVREETGYDCSSLINPAQFIEKHIRETIVRLYIIPGVDRKSIFQPITRNEIRSIQWIDVNKLPESKFDPRNGHEVNVNASYFMAIPFVKPLRDWIKRHKPRPVQEPRIVHSARKSVQTPVSGGAKNYPQQQVESPRELVPMTPTSRGELKHKKRKPSESNKAAVTPAKEPEKRKSKFWAQSWEKVKLDWNQIWREVENIKS